MAFTRLPTELLDIIITHVLPEGFESLAVTCRAIYASCIPFLQRHNALRSRFHHFTYGLDYDEVRRRQLRSYSLRCYSQHAAAFLLTILPNVERLILPQCWKPLDATNKLIIAFIHKTKQVHSLCDRPSLARITEFEPSTSILSHDRFDLGWASPFLALPRIRSFRGPSCVIMDDNHKSIVPKDPHYGFGETLESVSLVACCMDEVGIGDFLKDTKRLKSLRYSHSVKWDLSS